MISRKIIVNLSVFMLVAVILIVFGVVDLLGNPFAHSTTVSAVFPDASGLHPNFDVTYNGVSVGSVANVVLAPKGARVVIRIDPGVTVPRDVVATIDLANALGEQQLDLLPSHSHLSGGSSPLADGDVLKVDPNGVPASVGQLVAVASRLLRAIPPNDLNNVLHQAAIALAGRGQDLRTITEASLAFSQEFLHYQDQFKALLTNAPPVLNAVSAVGPQLRQSLTNTAVLLEVLANRRNDLSNAIVQGGNLAGQLQSLLTTSLPNVACLTNDLSDLSANVSQPKNLANLGAGLATNQLFFGGLDLVSPFGPAKSLFSGDPTHQQVWLRTRLLLPPVMPSASAYPAPVGLPPTKPGAACNTEFGPGVGQATQANAPAVGPGGSTQPPTAAQSEVRGRGVALAPAGSSTGQTTAFDGPLSPAGEGGPGAASVVLALLLGGGLVGGGLAAGRARTRRR